MSPSCQWPLLLGRHTTNNNVKAAMKKKIYIVEDHPVFREGLVQIVEGDKALTVCGQAASAEQALKAIPRLKPDLVLVDITLPGKNGLQLLKDLRAKERRMKVLVVSMHDEALYADRVLRAGGDGYIMKQEDPQEILQAIQDVLNGHIYVSEKVMAAKGPLQKSVRLENSPRPMAQLSDAEIEIVGLLGEGTSNEEIAQRMGIRTSALTRQFAEIQQKLKLTSLNALVRYAVCWLENSAEDV